MNIFSRLGQSLVLTALAAFSTPVVLIISIQGLLLMIGYLPGCDWLAHPATNQIWQFLRIFGGGNPMEGLITIGLTFAFVGGLFDLFNFYRYQSLKGN